MPGSMNLLDYSKWVVCFILESLVAWFLFMHMMDSIPQDEECGLLLVASFVHVVAGSCSHLLGSW